MGDKSEVEERWRRECEEWRERAGRAEERERERIEELRITEEKLACVTQEKTGRCALYMYAFGKQRLVSYQVVEKTHVPLLKHWKCVLWTLFYMLVLHTCTCLYVFILLAKF